MAMLHMPMHLPSYLTFSTAVTSLPLSSRMLSCSFSAMLSFGAVACRAGFVSDRGASPIFSAPLCVCAGTQRGVVSAPAVARCIICKGCATQGWRNSGCSSCGCCQGRYGMVKLKVDQHHQKFLSCYKQPQLWLSRNAENDRNVT